MSSASFKVHAAYHFDNALSDIHQSTWRLVVVVVVPDTSFQKTRQLDHVFFFWFYTQRKQPFQYLRKQSIFQKNTIFHKRAR